MVLDFAIKFPICVLFLSSGFCSDNYLAATMACLWCQSLCGSWGKLSTVDMCLCPCAADLPVFSFAHTIFVSYDSSLSLNIQQGNFSHLIWARLPMLFCTLFFHINLMSIFSKFLKIHVDYLNDIYYFSNPGSLWNSFYVYVKNYILWLNNT